MVDWSRSLWHRVDAAELGNLTPGSYFLGSLIWAHCENTISKIVLLSNVYFSALYPDCGGYSCINCPIG